MVGGRDRSGAVTQRSLQLWTCIVLAFLALAIGLVVTGLQVNLSTAGDIRQSTGTTVPHTPTQSATSLTPEATPVPKATGTSVPQATTAAEPRGSAAPVPEGSAAAETQGLAAPVPAAPPAPVRAAFIGDSYTQGGGADPDTARWSTVAAADMGWIEENYGRGGTGFVTTNSFLGCGLEYCPTYPEMVPEVVAAAPDVVVVAGGQNDFDAFSADPEGVRNAIMATYSGLRAGLPNAVIVAVGPSTTWGVDDAATRFDAIVREAAASVNGSYVSLLDPYVIDPAFVLADGHVNNDGHRAIAGRVVAALTG